MPNKKQLKTKPANSKKQRTAYQSLAAPSLRFSPNAWAKLLYMRDAGDTEIGGFGISRKDDLLLVKDFVTVKQRASVVSVEFDDDAVAEFFEEQVDLNLSPAEFARLWVHSHPGDCPLPSPTDEQTFGRVFGASDWAAMVIVARGGQTYCRLRFNSGPGGSIEIPVAVDYSIPFEGSDHEAWHKEYKANIHVERIVSRGLLDFDSDGVSQRDGAMDCDDCELFDDTGFDFEYDPWEDYECRI